MENKKIKEVLSSDNKAVHQSGTIFSRLFRRILYDTNITAIQWEALKRKSFNKRKSDEVDEMFSSHNMNWDVFKKALLFLKPSKITLSLTVRWPNHRTTVHEMVISEDGKKIEERIPFTNLLDAYQSYEDNKLRNFRASSRLDGK